MWTIVRALINSAALRTWVVFGLCVICTAIGVFISIRVFPPTGSLSGSQLLLLGVVIAAVMMLLSYGAKWADANSRLVFTPVDLLQYIVQGFLWPATWPALAEKIGQVVITKPT